MTNINLRNTVMTDNYDLNIWDKLSYETDGKETGGWIINIYTIRYVNDVYGGGTMLEDKTIELTHEEATRLTLGWEEALGGDYTPDEDFFIDKEGFFETYRDIPERVADLLNALPEYEIALEPTNSWG